MAAYMRLPRTTVIRKLDQLQRWGLIDRQGRRYHNYRETLNSPIGMRSYRQVRRFLRGGTGIDHLGHFAGLTASEQMKQSI